MKKKHIWLLAMPLFCMFSFSLGRKTVCAEEFSSAQTESIADSIDIENESIVLESGSEVNSAIPGVLPEAEANKWFETKVIPYILEYGATVLGVLTGLAVLFKKITGLIGKLVGAYEALKKSNEENAETKDNVKIWGDNLKEWTEVQEAGLLKWKAEQETSAKEWQKNQLEELKTWQAEQTAAMEKAFKQIAATVEDKLVDTCETVHKILDVEEIAYEDNPVLVSKGTAKKISEVIHNEPKEEKKKSENKA